MRKFLVMVSAAVWPLVAFAQQGPKPATEFTRELNAKVLQELPFSDRRDFENAQRGFIDRADNLEIKDAAGKVVWSLEKYKTFISDDKPAPDTVNPSLWRNAQLSLHYGLFKVSDNVFQVRGYDLANMTFVKGDTGWIVFDTLQSTETAKAAYDLVSKNLGARPIVAVVYSHSHADHYSGVRGIVDDADVASGKVKIIAPEGFLEHAISENVIAGNAMSRRAVFMYGTLLPQGPQGGVNAGLGQTTSRGTASLIAPTETISKTGQTLIIDGVTMEFQMTPGTEAPAEMNTWFPQWNALWMAENTVNTMHNIITLRGAQVRDSLAWADYISETIALYGSRAEFKFQSHHWPVWGNAEILEYLKKQRDVYKYMHDQSVNLMNQGLTGPEIAEEIRLPEALDDNWATRGYYGTLRHNSRGVYQRYMGWYDGNPSNLNPPTPVDAAKKYIEYMGGVDVAVDKAKTDFDKGEYRWVAEVMKQAVFADPDNAAAKNLLADALEQLGYQSESGPWRSVYLQGASELRNGVPDLPAAGGTAGPDVIRAMPPELLFEYLSVRLDPAKSAGKTLRMNFDFTDLSKVYGVVVENSVLTYGDALDKPNGTLRLTKNALDAIQLKETTVADSLAAGDLKVEGNAQEFSDFLSALDTFPFWFNIVTP